MRPHLVVLALLATPLAGQETHDLSPATDLPEGVVEVKIDRLTEYRHRQEGGEAPKDRIDVEMARRRLRIRHLEPDADGNNRVEIEYLSDRISREGATFGLRERTLIATHSDSIEIEIAAGAAIDDRQRRAARKDARRFLSPDPRAALLPEAAVRIGESWEVDSPEAVALFCDFESPERVSIEVTLRKISEEEGEPIALLEFAVEIDAPREEGRVRTEAGVRGLGELRLFPRTRRIESWSWQGTLSEVDRIKNPEGEPTTLGYEATIQTTEEYSYE